MLILIKEFLKDKHIEDILDVGTTEDEKNISSNFIIKNLGNYKKYKSISDQYIDSNFFSAKLNKSITGDFSISEIEGYKSDLVISNATIEHVGNFENQIKMCENILKLSKKYFIIITPNRYHPIEFHTKLPLLHWLPKKIHRNILSILGMNFLSKEENLNLLCNNDLLRIMKKLNHSNFEVKKINFLFFKSNLLLFGKII
tara:strand:- start:138 stop:737 length:600 start_codon:yes stop_codon:yes gene_type:complete